MERFFYYGKKHGKKLAICFFILAIFGVFVYQGFMQADADATTFEEVAITDINDPKSKDDKKEKEQKEEKPKEEVRKIQVDVKGAVNKPGVYKVDFGSIVNDLVSLAGGFKSNASTNSINLSKKVIDEMVLYIYTQDEIKEYQDKKKKEEVAEPTIQAETNSPNSLNTEPCKTQDYVICDCTDKKESIIVPEDASNNQEPISNGNKTEEENNGLVNINTASMEELMTIKGIGEEKARNIIIYRNENGNFASIEGIMNVSGIGDKLFEKIKDYITI